MFELSIPDGLAAGILLAMYIADNTIPGPRDIPSGLVLLCATLIIGWNIMPA